MLNKVTEFTVDGRRFLLVGTAHVSKESAELAKKVIAEENPDVVAVELDPQRYDSLLNKKRWDDTEIHKVIREKKTYLFLLQLLLANYQRKIGDGLGVKPGMEMLEAVNAAKEKKIEIALVDRDIRVTLKRAFSKMSLREKFSIFYGFFSGVFEREEINEDLIEKLKDKDVMTEMMDELSTQIPSIKNVLVDERDQYIAHKILSTKGKTVVAVLGAGHVSGVRAWMEKEAREGIDHLEELPKTKKMWKYAGYVIPAVFLALVAAGFYTSGTELTIKMLERWFLVNGVLSALGVLLALGHPISAAVAFLAAPFTSLNPTLAAGWFAGLAEAGIRKPKVRDFEELFQLNGIRDYWRNRVTRILLVIIFANIGSTAGTFIGLSWIAALLG